MNWFNWALGIVLVSVWAFYTWGLKSKDMFLLGISSGAGGAMIIFVVSKMLYKFLA